MSRVGNAPITIPGGVNLEIKGLEIAVKGPRGELKSPLPDGISLEIDNGVAQLKRKDDSRQMKEKHGMARALLSNTIAGVKDGWKKNLELVGVGYRANLKGKVLVFSLGYSHEIQFPLPEGVEAKVTDQTKIELESNDRQRVGQIAAEIRSLRPPEPYKGKGIRYSDEEIRRKAGKTGKK